MVAKYTIFDTFDTYEYKYLHIRRTLVLIKIKKKKSRKLWCTTSLVLKVFFLRYPLEFESSCVFTVAVLFEHPMVLIMSTEIRMLRQHFRDNNGHVLRDFVRNFRPFQHGPNFFGTMLVIRHLWKEEMSARGTC